MVKLRQYIQAHKQDGILNVMKTIFTRCFVIWLGLVVIYASFQILTGGIPLLSWIGLELTALSLLVFFIGHMKSHQLPDRKQTMIYTMLSGLGLVVCMAISYRYEQVAGSVHIWAGATFIAWVVFLRSTRKAQN